MQYNFVQPRKMVIQSNSNRATFIWYMESSRIEKVRTGIMVSRSNYYLTELQPMKLQFSIFLVDISALNNLFTNGRTSEKSQIGRIRQDKGRRRYFDQDRPS